jgi:hypothetical protein
MDNIEIGGNPLTFNPEYFTIKQSKLVGLWPTGDVLADSIIPYLRRIKKEKVEVLDVGVFKGDMTFRLLELDQGKIAKIYCQEVQPHDFAHVFHANFEDADQETKNRITSIYDGREVDMVIVNQLIDLDNLLEVYYNKLCKGGIFVGDGHHTVKVKEALGKFRKEKKITAPIGTINKNIWFWYKP